MTTVSRLALGLLGVALVAVALIAYRWVSPNVGGPVFDAHPHLKTFQRLATPVAMALVGLALVVAALVD